MHRGPGDLVDEFNAGGIMVTQGVFWRLWQDDAATHPGSGIGGDPAQAILGRQAPGIVQQPCRRIAAEHGGRQAQEFGAEGGICDIGFARLPRGVAVAARNSRPSRSCRTTSASVRPQAGSTTASTRRRRATTSPARTLASANCASPPAPSSKATAAAWKMLNLPSSPFVGSVLPVRSSTSECTSSRTRATSSTAKPGRARSCRQRSMTDG